VRALLSSTFVGGGKTSALKNRLFRSLRLVVLGAPDLETQSEVSMSNTISLAELANIAGKEMARLERVNGVDGASELRFRVWPFISQLIEAVQEELDRGDEEDGVPENVIVKAMAVIVALSSAAGMPLEPSARESYLAVANEMLGELAGDVDPDTLSQLKAESSDIEAADSDAPAACAANTGEAATVESSIEAAQS